MDPYGTRPEYEEPNDEVTSAILAISGDDEVDMRLPEDKHGNKSPGKKEKSGVSNEDEVYTVGDFHPLGAGFSTSTSDTGTLMSSAPMISAIFVGSAEEQEQQMRSNDLLRQQHTTLVAQLKRERSMQRRLRVLLFLCIVVVVIIVAVAATVALETSSADVEDDISNSLEPKSNQTTIAPISNSSETTHGSVTSAPSTQPTPLPTAHPTNGSVTTQPTTNPNTLPTPAPDTFRAFQTTDELRAAVDRWLSRGVGDTDLAATYGHPIGKWDVSKISNFSRLFDGCNDNCEPYNGPRNRYASTFTSDISMWNVSSATDMSYMFRSTWDFAGDLSTWDVSSVRDMTAMFNDASLFKSNLSNWDVSSVEKMGHMFSYALVFDGDLSKWDVSRVVNITSMFESTLDFNSDLSNWDVSNVIDASYVFFNATAYDHDLCDWGTRLPPDADTSTAFLVSACPNTDDPDLTANPQGPFCYTCV